MKQHKLPGCRINCSLIRDGGYEKKIPIKQQLYWNDWLYQAIEVGSECVAQLPERLWLRNKNGYLSVDDAMRFYIYTAEEVS